MYFSRRSVSLSHIEHTQAVRSLLLLLLQLSDFMIQAFQHAVSLCPMSHTLNLYFPCNTNERDTKQSIRSRQTSTDSVNKKEKVHTTEAEDCDLLSCPAATRLLHTGPFISTDTEVTVITN